MEIFDSTGSFVKPREGVRSARGRSPPSVSFLCTNYTGPKRSLAILFLASDEALFVRAVLSSSMGDSWHDNASEDSDRWRVFSSKNTSALGAPVNLQGLREFKFLSLRQRVLDAEKFRVRSAKSARVRRLAGSKSTREIPIEHRSAPSARILSSLRFTVFSGETSEIPACAGLRGY
jgi:hypothetical protein